MSETRKRRVVSTTLAAMATAMAVGAATAHAANTGLSAKQVRAIVQKEVAKVRRGPAGPKGNAGPAGVQGMSGPQGPAGPTGPRGVAGVDGMPAMFAHVVDDGLIDEATAVGIVHNNVRFDEEQTWYCFSHLPLVTGGQVTLEGRGGFGVPLKTKTLTPYITVFTGEPDCDTRVHFVGEGGNLEPASFYINLY